MSSRKLRRALVFTLVLSAGTLSLPHADAAALRSAPRPVVQTDLFSRSLEVVKNLLGLLKDASPGPPNGNDPKPPENREGSGVCPHGMHGGM